MCRGTPVMLIGYARVSTDDQRNASQLDALRQAGCEVIHEEEGSGGNRARPRLLAILRSIGPGDVLVVVRLDRLARSLQHLLEVIEILTARGAHFRSLNDPVDTSSPQGRFSLQVLGAVAELERALIRERTRAGLQAAARRGRVGGNPALRAGDAAARAALSEARKSAYRARAAASAGDVLPIVQRLRPHKPWPEVARAVSAALGTNWTADRLKRMVTSLVGQKLADTALLGRARPRRPADDPAYIVAGLLQREPGMTLADLARQLEAMRVKTARGATAWPLSSVAALRDRVRNSKMD
ncbi:MAG: recombinase family protein [Alphaproteobacteria bacterium]|nr:recombinase family protein [Alphaproteobacteria bacterium]